MMSHLFIACTCFLALAASIFAEGKEYDDEAIDRGNAYVNNLMKDMFENDDEYDPYIMEGTVVGFKKVVIFDIPGEAKFHSGYITGLKTLHRSGDCSLHDEGTRLRVKADLGAGVLNFHYSGSAKFMNFGPTITVTGDLPYIEVRVEFTVDSRTGKNGTLEKFVIDDMRGMRVGVSGLGPITWALNPIVRGVTKIFKRFVRNFMEKKVERHLKEKIPNLEFPVEGGESSTQDPGSSTPESTYPSEESKESSPETNPTGKPKETSPETKPTEEPKEDSSEANPTEEPKEDSSEANPTEEPKEDSPEANPTAEPKEASPETNPTEEPEEINSTEPEIKPEPEETSPPPELEESEESNPSDSETNAPKESREINSPKHEAAVEEVVFLQPDRESSDDSSMV